jgi:hypothetical protein
VLRLGVAERKNEMTKFKYTFKDWMKKVDATVERVMGCSVYDLPDYPFMDAYEDGCSYGNVASKVMKAAME